MGTTVTEINDDLTLAELTRAANQVGLTPGEMYLWVAFDVHGTVSAAEWVRRLVGV